MHTLIPLLVFALVIGSTATVMAQAPQGSPAGTATLALNGKALEIRYSAPSVRGRQIFGEGGLLSKDPTAWELVVNRQTGQWGLSYDASRDVGRVRMTMARPPAMVETLKYTLTDKGSGNGELRLEWENHVATVPIAAK